MEMERRTLNDVVDYTYGLLVNPDGLFMPEFLLSNMLPSAISSNPEILTRLDELYFSRSGEKYISPYLVNLLSRDQVWSNARARLTVLLRTLYKTQWGKLFATYDFSYVPLENYNMREQMTNDTTVRQKGSTITRNETDTKSFTGRETEISSSNTKTPRVSTTENKSISGFNSSNPVQADRSIITQDGNDTESGTSTAQERGTETNTISGTETGSGSDTDTRNYVLTRSGNIGVTTSQQMLQSEIDIWKMWEIFDNVIFPDIDKIITLNIY